MYYLRRLIGIILFFGVVASGVMFFFSLHERPSETASSSFQVASLIFFILSSFTFLFFILSIRLNRNSR